MARFKRFLFRFFFIFFFWSTTPWLWAEMIPGVVYLGQFYKDAMLWIVTLMNDNLLHVRTVLNVNGYGSGDTSYAWAEFYTIIILSLLIAAVWTAFDKNQKQSRAQEYWLHTLIRYNIIITALNYGIVKIFALQMPYPDLSQMATPLGDFLPMRLSWMFIGYSQPYEMFSGFMEVMVGLLLLYRRTIPLGLIIGLAVFTNVFMLNLCYDIPVKLFSMQIVICCLFLLLIDYQKYVNFFILNKPTVPTSGYTFRFTKRWKRIGRIVLKSAFILMVIVWNFVDCYSWYNDVHKADVVTIPHGVYNIKTFKKNNQLTAVDATDSLAWKDFIFDKQQLGSIDTRDTTLLNRYGRGYFIYETDKAKQMIYFKDRRTDTVSIFEMKYKLSGKRLELEGKFKNDTLYYELIKNDKGFPLDRKHFHWISEKNR